MSKFRSSLSNSVRYWEPGDKKWIIVGAFNTQTDAEIFVTHLSKRGTEVSNIFGLFHKNTLKGRFQNGERTQSKVPAPLALDGSPAPAAVQGGEGTTTQG